MALFVQVPGRVGNDNLPVVPLPSETEIAIYKLAGLANWWDAEHCHDDGTGVTRWVDRKEHASLTPRDAGKPRVQTDARTGQKVLRHDAVVTSVLTDGGRNLWPVGVDHTWVVVAAQGNVGLNSQALIGNGGASRLNHDANNKMRALVEGTTVGTSGPSGNAPLGELSLFVWSYRHAATRHIGRINGQPGFTATNATQHANALLQVGGAGSGTTAQNRSGRVAVIMRFMVALAEPEFAAELALVENYLLGRFPVVV